MRSRELSVHVFFAPEPERAHIRVFFPIIFAAFCVDDPKKDEDFCYLLVQTGYEVESRSGPGSDKNKLSNTQFSILKIIGTYFLDLTKYLCLTYLSYQEKDEQMMHLKLLDLFLMKLIC